MMSLESRESLLMYLSDILARVANAKPKKVKCRELDSLYARGVQQ